jgi:ketosteroid isomerase-like protein
VEEASVSDPITPPAAQSPPEAPRLVSLALSDGDLGAAIAQYESDAVLRPWADNIGTVGNGEGGCTVRETMVGLMGLRVPLVCQVLSVLPATGLAMLVCERSIDGFGPDGQRVSQRGVGCTVVRLQSDGTWRIAADAWCLTDEFAI